MSSPMIDVAELRDLHAFQTIQIVDCRFRLGQHGAGVELYREGHIPGALYLDLDDDLSGPMREDRLGGRHPLPTREAFAASLVEAGLRGDTPIALYDDGTGGAARAWWLLRHHGVASRVLRGGLEAWTEPLIGGDPPRGGGDIALGPERTDDLVLAEDVQAALAAGTTVLDARAPERYRGEVEPMDPVAGHIGGAVNAPFNAPELPPVPAGDAIAYCGSGVTAAALILRLEDEGRSGVRLYAGSWSDWCARGLAEPAS